MTATEDIYSQFRGTTSAATANGPNLYLDEDFRVVLSNEGVSFGFLNESCLRLKTPFYFFVILLLLLLFIHFFFTFSKMS
jgi:lipoprotein signal peptidase